MECSGKTPGKRLVEGLLRHPGTMSDVSACVNALSWFSLVGVSATAMYLVLSNALILLGIVPPAVASALAYGGGMVVSFLGHSRLTFRVERNTIGQVWRFLFVSVSGLLISYGCVQYAVGALGILPVWGTIAAALFVPLVSFFGMKCWVFVSSDR